MNTLRYVTASVQYYLYGQYQYLDPVEDPKMCFVRLNRIEPQSNAPTPGSSSYNTRKKFNLHFVPHLLLYVITVAWGIFGLQYYHTGQIELITLRQNPYIMTHQVSLPDMWAQVDLCFYGVIVASFCAYTSLVLNPVCEKKFKMILKDSGRLVIRQNELSKEDSYKICAFRQRYKTPIFVTILIFDLLAISYFNGMVLYQDLYRVHIVDALFWLILFPRLAFDIVFGVFGVMVFVIFSSKYSQIRLNSILSGMIKLNRKISNLSNKHNRFRSAWLEYTSLNRRLLSLCSDIDECTHFWSPFLSIMFPFFMWVQAYLAFIVFFVDSIPFVQKYLFLYGVIEFDLTLFLLIDQCARVVKLSQRILSENRRFFIAIQHSRFGERRIITNRNLLLAESLQISRRLHNFAFRLFGNYRITSKTFHLVISYMSIFCLLVIKSHKMKKSTSLI